MILIPVAAVRDILGEWAGDMTDAQISAEGLSVMIEAEIAATCPSWIEIVDADSLARLDTAIAYLAAARLVSNIGGVKSMTLGDQMITYNSNYIATEQSRWRRDALALISAVCPVPPQVSAFGVHFGKASGRRG